MILSLFRRDLGRISWNGDSNLHVFFVFGIAKQKNAEKERDYPHLLLFFFFWCVSLSERLTMADSGY